MTDDLLDSDVTSQTHKANLIGEMLTVTEFDGYFSRFSTSVTHNSD